ncbi:hypothetical protein O181_105631 [Austropuccinia psidii MF-1]|uniref:Uncharacterized protein n=1 Tax=Austropuccinia psidii MF-1 TaxID=1389203 RepID=A0A9Q3JPV3_9BASI|nr:hypothetical protein [Austropuccinia psidii MF-1]
MKGDNSCACSFPCCEALMITWPTNVEDGFPSPFHKLVKSSLIKSGWGMARCLCKQSFEFVGLDAQLLEHGKSMAQREDNTGIGFRGIGIVGHKHLKKFSNDFELIKMAAQAAARLDSVKEFLCHCTQRDDANAECEVMGNRCINEV